MPRSQPAAALAAVAWAVVLAAFARSDAAAAPAGRAGSTREGDPPWHDAASLKAALDEITGAHSGIARLFEYGRSRTGKELWCVELGPIGDPERARLPALLVVAGLDGQHLLGTELVLDHLRRLTAGYAADEAVKKLLDEHVVYLVPRANPDGAEAWFAPPGGARREVRGNLRPIDDDRDGAVDEDGPRDLDGDGWITQMRWRDPEGTLIEDPAEPRLLRAADPLKDERGTFKVAVESHDRDGDGEHGEDGPGDVVPARNFPQRWQEFDPAAGRVPMDEPEALALGRLLFDRPAIALVVVYGLHDNVSVDPKKDAAGEAGPEVEFGGRSFRISRALPGGIVKEDQPLYAELAARYREKTGVTSKPPLEADDGAFWTFAYFQFGVPTLAIHAWSPPLDVKAPEPEPEPEAEPEPKEGEPEGEKPREKPAEAKESGRRKEGASGDGKKADSDEPKLLLWNDHAMGGSAFVPWTKVAHPTLGEVEVGGWKPYARILPPADAVAELASKHSDFLLHAGSLLAAARIGDVKVEDLGSGLYRVTAAVVNEGWLPTACGMGERNRRPRPTRLDLDLGGASLLQGEARHSWRRIEGGGREEAKWILKAEPGSAVLLRLWSEKAGADERAVTLK